jgi:hypothetical protein
VPNIHAMRARLAGVAALVSLCASACSGSVLLSSPSQWGGDFTDRATPTAECPGGSLSRLRTRMDVSVPFTPATFEAPIPEMIRRRLADGDRLHTFYFGTDPDAAEYRGFSGYLVSRGDCIVHAEITSHDN